MTTTANGHPHAYDQLVERLNRFPQGAPPTPTLYKILQALFTEREAALIAQVPVTTFTVRDAARIWRMDEAATQRVLDDLASRVLLIDTPRPDGKVSYTLPPPMAGFIEFSMMRLRDDVDQKMLAELYHQYCTIEPNFFGEMFARSDTQMGRIFINERVIPETVRVFDYERASEVVNTATHMGISMCYCRHKMQHVDQACGAPMDICMTFNDTAQALIRHGHARQVDAAEGQDLLAQAYDHNLVQFGDNAREEVNFICNCCGCCCEAMIAARRFAPLNPLHTTNFLPEVDTDNCNGCGKCVNVCPIEAISLVSAHDPAKPKAKKALVNEDVCLGCGVCARMCDQDGIAMQPRAERVIPPKTFAHRVVLAATERGQLQDLLFDRTDLWSHRALRTLFGAILKLPPVKRTLAVKQVQSRYLETMITRASKS